MPADDLTFNAPSGIEWEQFLEDGRELVSADLSAMTFDSIELEGRKFRQCLFDGVAFQDVRFVDCKFINCQFINCSFAKAALLDCELTDCKFLHGEGGPREGCAFRFSDLHSCLIEGCNFSFTEFQHCNLYNSEIHKSKFTATVWKSTGFSRQISRKKILVSVKLTHTDFSHAVMPGINFDECTLYMCGFQDADLSESTFRSASVLECNLMSADIANCDFEDCDVRGSVLAGFDLRKLRSYFNMTISMDQQPDLLAAMGVLLGD